MVIRPLRVILTALALTIAPVFAAPGDLDATFGTGGRVTTDFGGTDSLGAVLVQPDGKIVAVGSSDTAVSKIALARYDSAGALDPTFGTGGMVTTKVPGASDDFGEAAVLLDDGKVVVAGRGGDDFVLLRYDVNGVLDPTFGNAGFSTITTPYPMNGAVQGLVRQPNGKLVAAGYVYSGLAFDFGVRRYEADGTLDLTFGDNGLVKTPFGSESDIGTDVALQPDGKIVVVGYTVSGTDYDIALARYLPDGTLDGTFGLGGKVVTAIGPTDLGYGVAIQPDGKIVVVGVTNNVDLLVARYDSSGGLDPAFGTGGIATISLTTSYESLRDVRLLPDGKLLVVGYRVNTAFPVSYEIALVRLDAGGVPDAGFGTGGVVTTAFGTDDALGVAMALQADGTIVVGAQVGDVMGTSKPDDFALARYEGTPAVCGDGAITPEEGCDDGGVVAGDGCDATCQIEAGYACAGTPSVCTAGCGDGTIAGSEACDDGNLVDGDGCGATCELEPGWSCSGVPTTCTSICGDSRIVGGEQCDDGNAVGGDCCDATCQFEAVGSPCLDERSPCHTTDTCTAGGVCTHVTSADPLCLQPIQPAKAKLKIVRSPTGKDQLVFKWIKGPGVPVASFGVPPTGTPYYTLCVYDEAGGITTPIVQASPATTPTFECNKDYGCWIATPVGWKYKANTGVPDGIVSLLLRGYLEPGKSKVQAKMKGSSFVAPALPLAASPRVVAEMRTSDGQCFGAAFSVANRNDAVQFSAKSD